MVFTPTSTMTTLVELRSKDEGEEPVRSWQLPSAMQDFQIRIVKKTMPRLPESHSASRYVECIKYTSSDRQTEWMVCIDQRTSDWKFLKFANDRTIELASVANFANFKQSRRDREKCHLKLLIDDVAVNGPFKTFLESKLLAGSTRIFALPGGDKFKWKQAAWNPDENDLLGNLPTFWELSGPNTKDSTLLATTERMEIKGRDGKCTDDSSNGPLYIHRSAIHLQDLIVCTSALVEAIA